MLDSSVPRQFDLVWKTPDSGQRVQSGEGSAVNGVEKTLVEEKGELTMGSSGGAVPKKVNDGDGVVTDASNGTVRTGASSFDGDSGNNTTNAADVDAAGVHDALLGDIPTLSSTSLASATTPILAALAVFGVWPFFGQSLGRCWPALPNKYDP